MFWGKINEISRVVREIPACEIAVGPNRPRRAVPDESLRALAESIREHGVIEPLLVRRLPANSADGKTCALIAGERRLRAAELAGAERVPCVFAEADDADAAVLAILENLHREDLNLFEGAAAIASLIELTGMTQEQCARRLGVSQSYVANKLRLLRLSEEDRRRILEGGLTERHSRALLRIEDPGERREVLGTMVERKMNVASAEEYVESLLCAGFRAQELRRAGAQAEVRRRLIVRDTRRFTDSIDRAVDVIRKSGIPVESSRRETPGGTLISILLPKSS